MLSRLDPQAQEKPPGSYDQPDGARQYYLMKRSGPDGKAADLVSEYRRAIDRMERMPRYSTRAGRTLPSLSEIRRSKESRRLAQPDLLSSWEFVGPGNIGGRTRALLLDPANPEIMFATGVSGGIWKTENGGASWRPLADLLPNIAVNSMAMDPVDSRIIYAGTGEGYFREIVRGTGLPLRGEGILKTVDGGDSWERLAGTSNPDFYWVNDLVISRSDPRRIYAATRTGVWRSADAGQNWSRILNAEDATGGCLDLALRTDLSGDYLFAACGTFQQATVYLNAQAELDGTWTPVLSEYGMGRTSLAIAPSDPNIVHALSASYVSGPGGLFNGGLHAVFRSDQGGSPGTWQATVRNTDGGETWISLDGDGTTGLPDISVHAMVVDPNNRQHLYLTTDLGVFTTRQGGNVWAVENSGFANAVTESLSLQQRPGETPVLWAFTHGRGAWRVPLASQLGPPPCTPDRWIPHVTPAGVPYETTVIATNFAMQESQVDLIPTLKMERSCSRFLCGCSRVRLRSHCQVTCSGTGL